jgi:hypothetical protein
VVDWSSIFNCLKNLHTHFHSGCTNLRSHQHFQFPLFLTRICCYFFSWLQPFWLGSGRILMAVLICIFLKGNDVEYFFMYLLDIYTSFEKYLFSSFASSLIVVFVILVFSFWVLYTFRLLIPCWMSIWQRFFAIMYAVYSLCSLFIAAWELFNLIQYYLSGLILFPEQLQSNS